VVIKQLLATNSVDAEAVVKQLLVKDGMAAE
jgi:hypothetical protein